MDQLEKNKVDVDSLREKYFAKNFFKLMNNAIFGKNMENGRQHKGIKFVRTEARNNYLASEPNYHTTKFSSENLLAIEMKKNKQISINIYK